MNHTDDNHRYRPYYRHNKRYDDDYKHQYKKPNRQYYPYQTTARRDHKNYHDSSYRRSYKNDYHYQSTRSKPYSYFSSPPPPLMSTPVIRPLLPPPPPPPVNIVPHERESWIRSVKRTKINESDEQKTQYLETMLRMPQQKTSLNASKFDRMRFSDSHLSATSTTNNLSNEHLHESSFQLIEDVHSNEDIRTLEKILFDNDIQQTNQSAATSPQSVNESEVVIVSKISSGFLIDNCDDGEDIPPDSSPPRPFLPPLSEDVIKSHEETLNEERVMLVSELNAADAERKQELKRQKRLQKKLQKNKPEQTTTTTAITENQQSDESPSDWIVEYDINQVSKLTDEIRRTSITMTNEDKTQKVNLILTKIKKQQEELRKLRQYVMSMLDEQDRPQISNSKRSNSHLTHDLLLSLLNQTTSTGCWLCSGKTYSEVATQCESDDDDSDKQ